MSLSGSVWLIIVAAFMAANGPFVNQRWGLLGPVASAGKPLFARLAELVVLYFVVGGLALLLGRRAGQIAPPGADGAGGLGVLCHHRAAVPDLGIPRLCLSLPAAPPWLNCDEGA